VVYERSLFHGVIYVHCFSHVTRSVASFISTVAIRLRPSSTKEVTPTRRTSLTKSHRDDDAWLVEDGTTLVQKHATFRTTNRTAFTYDAVFDTHDTTEQVYRDLCAPIVQEVVHGRHGTIFAYGQTGSGKTHTMQGSWKQPGVIGWAAHDLFAHLRAQESMRSFSIQVQYFEIYNEQIRDLLVVPTLPHRSGRSPEQPQPPLTIHESPDGNVHVNGTETLVHSVQDMLQVLERGNQQRTCAATDSNDQSSRSHAIFRVTVTTRCTMTGVQSSAHLNLVDLAGSESSHRSGTTGVRKREGGKINQR
jgi:hypothetical protein